MLDTSHIEAKLAAPKKKPVAYWADRAVQISKLLGTHRTRWFRQMKGVSNHTADLYLSWAKEATEIAKNPAAWFTDRMADPKKYVTPKK